MAAGLLCSLPPASRAAAGPQPAQAQPVEPAALLPGQLALALAQLAAQLRAPLVLLLPVVGAVLVPVLAELGREVLGEQQEPDVVASRGEVLLDEAGLAVAAAVVVVVVVIVSTAAALHQLRVDVVVAARRGGVEEGRVREQEGQIGEQLAPPGSADHDDLGVDAAQAAVCDGEPATRPAHAALPLPGAPDEDGRDDAAHERDLLAHLDHPVDGAADAAAVFAGPQEQRVGEVGNPEGQQHAEEGVLAAALAQGQVLRAQGALEDEQVQVDLRRRRGQRRQRIGSRGARRLRRGRRQRRRRRRQRRLRGRGALDELVQRRGHGGEAYVGPCRTEPGRSSTAWRI